MTTVQCPHCGEGIQDDFKLCPHCGKAIQPPQPTVLQCPCGATILSNFKICPYCGTENKPKEEPAKKCPHCSLAVEDEGAFCPHCGKNMSAQPVPMETASPRTVSASNDSDYWDERKGRVFAWVIAGLAALAVVFFCFMPVASTGYFSVTGWQLIRAEEEISSIAIGAVLSCIAGLVFALGAIEKRLSLTGCLICFAVAAILLFAVVKDDLEYLAAGFYFSVCASVGAFALSIVGINNKL